MSYKKEILSWLIQVRKNFNHEIFKETQKVCITQLLIRRRNRLN